MEMRAKCIKTLYIYLKAVCLSSMSFISSNMWEANLALVSTESVYHWTAASLRMWAVLATGWVARGREKGKVGKESNSCLMAEQARSLCCWCSGCLRASVNRRMPFQGWCLPSWLTDGISSPSGRSRVTSWFPMYCHCQPLRWCFSLEINADGLLGAQYKQVTKSVVPGVSS